MVVLSECTEGSSSSSTNDPTYDVFLSFRGVDTRHGFTDHLNKALIDANISTFLDDAEIDTGEHLKSELPSAIKASRASIIVLSKNYASSTWCLDELVLILEQSVASNHIVIPVFYNVDPTNVRMQQSSFGDAMAEHRQKMERETDADIRCQTAQRIERWNKALTKVADLKGMNANGRRETDLIEEIVKNIYHRLRARITSALSQLIGREDSVDFVTSWLKDDSSRTGDILTIMGMGGIGKTSLTKYIYGLHFREFDTSSFIEDISRVCVGKFNGLLDSQKQLCNDISKRSSTQVHDVSTYTSKIGNVLASRRALVVLDDIGSLYQLDALLGKQGFHPGSKIIITTKDKCLTESCEIFKTKVKPRHAKHLLQGLPETESQRLLCNHAFVSNDPKAGYEEVSEKLVNYCEGHPLALKILGKSLHNKDVAYWKGQIERLEKENVSPVNSVLRMSFDFLLSKNDKDLFKQIACFFVGMDRDETETILMACGIETRSGIMNLIDKCLLSIGGNNELVMHQLIQEMGRCIVREESPEKPWKRSGLWCHEESLKVLKQKKGTENIVGLTLDTRMLNNEELGETVELETDALSKMDNLMLLQLNNVKIKGSYKDFPKELRWLCMHGFPLKSIPPDLPMENLVALDMSYSNMESFGVCYNNPQSHMRQKTTQRFSKEKMVLKSLRILNLSFCVRLHSLCGLDGFPALERLILRYCISLGKVCESIEQCVELVHIDLSYCNNLQRVPNIGNLDSVKTLLLDGCDLGEPRISLRNINSPEMFNANNIGIRAKSSSSVAMKAIPSDSKFLDIFLPRCLVRLSLANNKLSNNSFPKDLSGLSMLKDLCLDENPIVFLPNCVRSLPKLEKLSMKECKMLRSVKHPPQTLTHLDLYVVDDFDKSSLEYVVFDPEMSPLRLSLEWKSLAHSSYEIQGMVKIQPIADVAENLLFSLGWPKLDFLDQRHVKIASMFGELKGSQIQMFYEFGIFSTFYGGKEIPNWVSYKSNGPSISFIIPLMPNLATQPTSYILRGLNFFFVLKPSYQFPNSDLYGVHLPMIEISNITKNLKWLYHHYIYKVNVGGECLTLLSHWMFGINEMENGDHVTITLRGLSDDATKECGVGFVYDDGKIDDALDYYKSWNHIIGGDLTGFQLTTGGYSLSTSRFWFYESDLETYGFGGFTGYKEAAVWFRALSQRKSNVLRQANEEEDNEAVNDGFSTNDDEKGRSECPSETISMVGSVNIDQQAVTIGVLDHRYQEVQPTIIVEATRNTRAMGHEEHAETETKYDNLDHASKQPSPNETKFGSCKDGFFKANEKLHVGPKEEGTNLNLGLKGFDIQRSKRKKKLLNTAEDVIHELDKPLFEEDDWNLSCGRRHRPLLMEAEYILEFPEGDRDREGSPFITPSKVNCPMGTPVANGDKGKASDANECTSESVSDAHLLDSERIINSMSSSIHPKMGTETKLTDYSDADLYHLLRIKAAEQAALMDEAANRGDCFAATKLECVRLREERRLLVEQVQQLDSIAHDVQMQYEESQNKTKAIEAERSVLVGRLSKAESELENSEASNELLESENKRLLEKVAMLEAADTERVRQLEVAREGFTADLEWFLKQGLPRCFDKVLESETFLRAYKQLQKACIEYGRESGCSLMRERFQLSCSAFAETDYVAAAGIGDFSMDDLRAFCLSSDEESS